MTLSLSFATCTGPDPQRNTFCQDPQLVQVRHTAMLAWRLLCSWRLAARTSRRRRASVRQARWQPLAHTGQASCTSTAAQSHLQEDALRRSVQGRRPRLPLLLAAGWVGHQARLRLHLHTWAGGVRRGESHSASVSRRAVCSPTFSQQVARMRSLLGRHDETAREQRSRCPDMPLENVFEIAVSLKVCRYRAIVTEGPHSRPFTPFGRPPSAGAVPLQRADQLEHSSSPLFLAATQRSTSTYSELFYGCCCAQAPAVRSGAMALLHGRACAGPG